MTKSDGLGLGLSICRSFIEAHGGHLWTTANRSAVATFRIKLPRALRVLAVRWVPRDADGGRVRR
jgi:signal transduction histidine kinase